MVEGLKNCSLRVEGKGLQLRRHEGVQNLVASK